MGVRYVKRNRMEGLPSVPDPVLASIGMTNIKFEKFDEQLIFDIINKELDIQQKRINAL
jgi:hypothetical protein